MLGRSLGFVHSANEVPSGRGKAPLWSSVDTRMVITLQALCEECSLRPCGELVNRVSLLNLNNPDKPL